MDKYVITGRIGEGAHGHVLLGKSVETKEEVALKKILVKKRSEGIPPVILREIKTMQQLDSPNVMKLLDYFPHGTGFILVFEYMPSGLYEMLQDPAMTLPQPLVKAYFEMILRGLQHMHENGIMHRDLKPANILIGFDGVLKIADFGQARPLMKNRYGACYTQQVATRWYRAPELLFGSQKYTEAVDLWAAGCIFAEMFQRSPLFQGETDIDQLAIVIRTLGTPTETNWPGHSQLPDYNKISFAPTKPKDWNTLLPGFPPTGLKLLREFIKYDQGSRISAGDALVHEYFFTPPFQTEYPLLPKPDHDHRFSNRPKEHPWELPNSFIFNPGTQYVIDYLI